VRIAIQVSLGINARPYSKNTYSKSAEEVFQMVEYLPGKHKTMSSNDGTAKKEHY
jgi:hypothetical protein